MTREKLITGVESGRTFRLGRRIATGDLSAVYRAREVGTPAGDEAPEYAAKLPRPLYSSDAQQVVQQGGERQSRFSHPHIARAVVDLFVHRNSQGAEYTVPVVLTPLAPTTLEQVVSSNGPLPVEDAVSVVEQIGTALEAVHTEGLLFIDTKPENVLLNRTPQGLIIAQLNDFGGATSARPEEQDDNAFASILYSAPEVFAGIRSRASDVWGLAAGVIFPAFTGSAPYDTENFPTERLFNPSTYAPPYKFKDILGKERITPLHQAAEDIAIIAMSSSQFMRYRDITHLLVSFREKVAKAREK